MKQKSFKFDKPKIKAKNKTDNEKIKDTVLKMTRNFYEGLPSGKFELVIRKPKSTSRQHKALHVFFKWLSEALNEVHAWRVLDFMGKQTEVMWTPVTIKEDIWRKFTEAMYNKTSSKDLTTTELVKVADALQDRLAVNGIIINFPNMLDMINNIQHYEIIK